MLATLQDPSRSPKLSGLSARYVGPPTPGVPPAPVCPLCAVSTCVCVCVEPYRSPGDVPIVDPNAVAAEASEEVEGVPEEVYTQPVVLENSEPCTSVHVDVCVCVCAYGLCVCTSVRKCLHDMLFPSCL